MGRGRNRSKARRKAQLAQAGQDTWPRAATTTVIGPKATQTAGAKTDSYPTRCHSHPASTPFHKFDNGTTIYAGSKVSLESAIDAGRITPAIVLNLSGIPADFCVEWPVSVNEKASAALPEMVWADRSAENEPGIVAIDWDDGGIPIGLNKEWWQALADALKDINGDVAIVCVGGHGRTGTALAILAHMWGIVPSNADPVEFTRAQHCEQAVETQRQIIYVEMMTDEEVFVSGSYSWSAPYRKGQTATGGATKTTSVWNKGTQMFEPVVTGVTTPAAAPSVTAPVDDVDEGEDDDMASFTVDGRVYEYDDDLGTWVDDGRFYDPLTGMQGTYDSENAPDFLTKGM